MSAHDDSILDRNAALAVGALDDGEARAARAHLIACAECREDYRAYAGAVDVVAAAAAAPERFTPADARRNKRAIVAAALEARPPAPVRAGGYGRVVPHDAMIEFAPGIRWAVVPVEGMTLVYWLFDLPPGTSLPPEQHPNSQAGIVLEGAMVMNFGDGTTRRFATGDVYAIAPGTTHEAVFPERTMLFDVYTPRHESYEELYAAAHG